MRELTFFGQKCAEMRKRLGITQDELAKKMGYTQEYLSKLENGRKTLTIPLLKNYLAAFKELGQNELNKGGDTSGIFPLEEQLEFTRELFDHSGKIEIDLSNVTIIHRNSLTRMAAILTLDDFFPMDVLDNRFISWMPVNKAVDLLRDDPELNKPGPLELAHRLDGYYKNIKG